MSTRHITTFYSYKGGVGRSMALANIATILALRRETVLVIDFDLEAPGLHRYFIPAAHSTNESSERGAGVIDLFEELQKRLLDRFSTEGSYDPTNSDTMAVCRAIVDDLVDKFRGYTISVGDGTQTIQFLPAGLFNDQYQNRIRHFDWVSFFETFREVFELLRDAWKKHYEHVFIDSRTGLTDIGSVTTMILPDRLIVVFTPNEQSLHGGIEIARQAMLMKHKLSPEPLVVFPLLARVDPALTDKRRAWLEKIARRWSTFFVEMCDWPDFDWLRYFEQIHIPHNALLAYGEPIVAKEMLEHRGVGTLAQAFDAFALTLDADTLATWFAKTPRALAPRRDRALLVIFDADIELPERFSFETIVRVPGHFTVEQRQALRTPGTPDPWQNAAKNIERALKDVIRGLRGHLHVFVMAPYAAAIFVGRCLDEFARAIPIHIHQFDTYMHDWVVFSTPASGKTSTHDEPWFQEPEIISCKAHSGPIILAVEGSQHLSEATLDGLAKQTHAHEIVRLRPTTPRPLATFAQALQANLAIRRTLENIHEKHPRATIQVVTTAPVAMMVELGRMLSSSVYVGVIVHQYQPLESRYFPAIDVMRPFDPMNLRKTQASPRKSARKKP